MTRLLLAGVAALALIFAISNPQQRSSEVSKPPLDTDPRMNALFERACANCHSNQTERPWYGRVGPGAWLIDRDVKKGRALLDLSKKPLLLATERREVVDAVDGGVMPPKLYLLMHPEAHLTAEDKKVLEAWAAKAH